MKLKDKLKAKIDRLLKEGHAIKYLPASRYIQEPIRLDKITIAKHSITSFDDDGCGGYIEKERFERVVCLDFERNPVLTGEEAEEVYNHLIKGNNSALDAYLNS